MNLDKLINLTPVPKIEDESVSNTESKEKKKQNLEIEIDGKKYSLETDSYDFEYPKNIQEETGIIGYERTVISKEALHKIHNETGGESGEILTKEILSKLSEGEFFNLVRHQMGYYAGLKEKEVYNKKFADQGFILQKIFDIDGVKELKEENDKSVFSHGATSNNIKFGLFDKKTLEVIEEDITTTRLPEYTEKVTSGDVFLCNTNSGLSDKNSITRTGPSPSGSQLNLFWDKSTEKSREEHDIQGEFPVSPVFAFDPREPHLHKYFSDTYDLYKNLNKVNHTNITGHKFDVFYNLYEKINYKNLLDGSEERIHHRNFIKNIDEEFGQDPTYQEKDKSMFRLEKDEGVIPVIIGHDKIKQLRWGDSKYAVFYTQKGLNFLKIRHADHLPQKA